MKWAIAALPIDVFAGNLFRDNRDYEEHACFNLKPGENCPIYRFFNLRKGDGPKVAIRATNREGNVLTWNEPVPIVYNENLVGESKFLYVQKDSNPNSASEEAYLLLGLKQGASFEEVQQARNKRLLEIGDDPILKAKIESSYDALLMDSLKARQLGKVSNAAANASIKEKSKNEIGGSAESSLLTRIGKIDFSGTKGKGARFFPDFSLPEGQGLTIRLALGVFALVLMLISPDESIQIILS